MNIIEKYLTVNPYTRPGRRRIQCRGIVFHDVGVPQQKAIHTWSYFENVCTRKKHFSSAHYIIDLNGDVYHTIPDNEVAYHCGSAIPDPASGKIYTDWARAKYGYYASDPMITSPNNCTIGVELCINKQWEFTPETIHSAIALAAKLLEENHLLIEEIGHHNMVVGWKDCPFPWVKNPSLFEKFKEEVKVKMGLLL